MDDSGISSKATEFAKKLLTVGVGAFFLTEEALKGLSQDFKLPKEFLSSLLDSTKTLRKDFIENLSKEVFEKVSSRVDPVQFMTEFLRKNEIKFEIKMTVHEKVRTQDQK